MRIEVIATVGEAVSEDLLNKTVIAIDVLRATTVMTTALELGAKEIVPVETVAQAKSLQEAGVLLGGERNCKKIPGFDFGNSPLEYEPALVQGRRIVMTTTNGTRAIQKAQRAGIVLGGCLRNAAACAKAAVRLGRDVTILCAGTQDMFSLEDGLCAGLLVHELRSLQGGALPVSDFGLAMEATFLSMEQRLTESLLDCANGMRLTKLGFKDDIHYCAKLNVSETVPALSNQAMISLRF